MHTQKIEQLHIRASLFQKSKLAEAARAKNMNVSQFVLQVSLDAADDILAAQSPIILTPLAFAEFCRLLDEPPTVLPKLRTQIEKGSIFK